MNTRGDRRLVTVVAALAERRSIGAAVVSQAAIAFGSFGRVGEGARPQREDTT
jgi:hypothetical protein